MSILLSMCFLLSAAINKSQSAPKLGHVLFDPLSYEAKLTKHSQEIYNSQEDWLEESLRMPSKLEQKTSKKPCSGYDYDETLCKTIDDRIVCGYNKNKGNISDKIADLGNGCRIRGGRLECGYLVGPFNNPRRPPANDDTKDTDGKSLNLRYGSTESSTMPTQSTTAVKENNANVTSNQTKRTKFSTEYKTNSTESTIKNLPVISSTVKTSLVNNSTFITTLQALSGISRRQYNATKPKRYCVEKNDRIFCYFMKQ